MYSLTIFYFLKIIFNYFINLKIFLSDYLLSMSIAKPPGFFFLGLTTAVVFLSKSTTNFGA